MVHSFDMVGNKVDNSMADNIPAGSFKYYYFIW